MTDHSLARGRKKSGQAELPRVSWSAAWAQGGEDIGDRCDLSLPLDESTAREERYAQAIVRSLTTNPYCS